MTDPDLTEPDVVDPGVADPGVTGRDEAVPTASPAVAPLEEAGSAPVGRGRRYGDDRDEVDVDDDRDEVDLTDEGDRPEDDANRPPAPVALAVLHHITRSVVDDPEAVDIAAIPLRAGRVRLAVRVAPNDFGRLIGRRGRVAAAVRTLVGAAAVKDGVDVEVEFVE